jgi:hypothetical protein
MAFLCVFQQGEFKNFLKSPCQKPFTKNFFPGSWIFFPSFFLIAFLAVSLHDKPKNTTVVFPKIRPENLKKSQKKVRRFFAFFLQRPLSAPTPLRRAFCPCRPPRSKPQGPGRAGVADRNKTKDKRQKTNAMAMEKQRRRRSVGQSFFYARSWVLDLYFGVLFDIPPLAKKFPKNAEKTPQKIIERRKYPKEYR